MLCFSNKLSKIAKRWGFSSLRSQRLLTFNIGDLSYVI